MFTEKAQGLKEKEELQARNQSLEIAIEQAYKIFPEFNIPKDAATTAKVRKLAIVFCASKDENSRVTFDFQMNVSKL